MKQIDVLVNDIVQLRKQHPCGSDRWRVYRVGADIGIRCEGCGRRVLMSRPKLARKVKMVLQAKPDALPGDESVNRGEP